MSKSYSFALALIKKYKWQSIFVKYWKSMLIMFLLPFLIINVSIYYLFNNMLSNELESSLSNVCEKTATTLESIFDKIDVQFSNLAYNSHFLSYITMPIEGNDNVLSYLGTIRTLTQNFMATNDYVESIYIYSFVNDYVYSSSGGNLLENFSDTIWYEHYLKTGNPNFIISSNDRIVVSYGVYSGQKVNGMIMFNISKGYVDEVIESDLKYNLNSLCITDENKNIVYSSDNFEGTIDKNHRLHKATEQSALDELVYLKQSDGVFLSKSILSGRLNLVFDANSNYFSERTAGIKIFFFICFLCAIFIPILMSLYLSLKFYNSLHTIIAGLSTTDSGDDLDEISHIMQNISNITAINKNFEAELVTRIQQLKRAQTMALHMQFNPHFLFNTLNMINLSVASKLNGDNEISQAIVLLSDLLYASMNTGDYIITLREEIDYENKYIDLLGIQHDNTFEIEWDIDERTLSSKVLKLMLQPIIENAFQHGMKPMKPDRLFKIKISSEIRGKILVVTVTNNGEPIEKKRLNQITQSLENDDILQHKHIGLNNINQRIKLIYGDEYGCSIFSDSEGTTVTIELPNK